MSDQKMNTDSAPICTYSAESRVPTTRGHESVVLDAICAHLGLEFTINTNYNERKITKKQARNLGYIGFFGGGAYRARYSANFRDISRGFFGRPFVDDDGMYTEVDIHPEITCDIKEKINAK